MQNTALNQISCRKFFHGTWHAIKDVVPPEIQLNILWSDSRHTLWAFPNDLQNLALGHAALELCTQDEKPEYISHEKTTYVLQPFPRKTPRCALRGLPFLQTVSLR